MWQTIVKILKILASRLMPHFLAESRKQLSTEEANETRLFTNVRWVMESVNGSVKQRKALANVFPNSQ